LIGLMLKPAVEIAAGRTLAASLGEKPSTFVVATGTANKIANQQHTPDLRDGNMSSPLQSSDQSGSLTA
jgi:hypothetical protein